MDKNNSASSQSLEFGKSGFSFEIINADKDGYADIFSEGSSALKNLLLHLWNNNIKTVACCSGHPSRFRSMKDKVSHLHNPHTINKSFSKDQCGYFSFEVNDGSEKTTYTTASMLRDYLSKLSPSTPCTVTAHLMSAGFKTNSVCINFKQYLYEPELRHAIFDITNALSKVLVVSAISNDAKDQKFVMTDERKPALDVRIKAAQAHHDAKLAAFQKSKEQGTHAITDQGKSVFVSQR